MIPQTQLRLGRTAAPAPDAPAGRPLHVLVVEDDPDARSNLADLLELGGHSVRTAASAAEVLAHPDLAAFEAVLLDWTLPDGNAGTLLPELCQRAPEADVFVITGRGDLDSAVTALREGAADYLLKPIDIDALLTAFARVTAARQAREDQQKRLAVVGQMVSVVAHESKNELAVIHTATELLEEFLMGKGRVDALRAEASEAVKLIRQAEGNLLRLLEDVRGYVAPVILDRRPWDLTRIWRAAWERAAAKREGPRAILDDEPADSPLVASVDGFRMGQVFRNLFENSLAAKGGPVRVEVRCREAEVGGQGRWNSRCGTMARGFRPNSGGGCSSRFTRRRRLGQDWGWRSCGGSSRLTAGQSRSATAGRGPSS